MKKLILLIVDNGAEQSNKLKKILSSIGNEDIEITDNANDAWTLMRIKAFEAMRCAYRELGMNEKAQEYLQIAADIYIGREKMQDAESVLNEILEISPDSINVYNSLGVLYRRRGDLKTSLNYYQKALKVHPKEPHIHYNIGRLFFELKRPE